MKTQRQNKMAAIASYAILLFVAWILGRITEAYANGAWH